MKTWYRTPLTLITLALLPLQTEPAHSRQVCPPANLSLQEPGSYPDYELSPLESLRLYDAVFFGEVAVPSKTCSLGSCAGIKVLKTLKGKPPQGNLVQVTKPGASACPPAYFSVKGEKWIVFANAGTTKTGLKFLYAEDLGPSFPSLKIPNFMELEAQYQALRSALDHAINRKTDRSYLR